MNILLIVNHSPWGSTLANTALRCARGVLAEGHQLQAVFFQGDGVYNAIGGDQADAGAENLAKAWGQVALSAGCELLLCSSASTRRVPASLSAGLPAPFRTAGLSELVGLICNSDRVVSF